MRYSFVNIGREKKKTFEKIQCFFCLFICLFLFVFLFYCSKPGVYYKGILKDYKLNRNVHYITMSYTCS